MPAHDNTACDSQSAHQHNTALTISAPASIYTKFSRHVSLQIRKQLIKTLVKYVVLEVSGRAKTQFHCKHEISHHKTNWSLFVASFIPANLIAAATLSSIFIVL